jgi:hypothetical protein
VENHVLRVIMSSLESLTPQRDAQTELEPVRVEAIRSSLLNVSPERFEGRPHGASGSPSRRVELKAQEGGGSAYRRR